MASDLPTFDVQKALRNALRKMEPSLAITLEMAAVAFPVLIAGSVWLVRANYLPAMALGFIGGFACMLVAYVYQRRRGAERRSLAARVAATSCLTRPLIDKYFKWKKTEAPPWVVVSDNEKVEWLNTIMRHMWPQLNKAASNLITEILTPILDAYKMGMVKKLSVVSFNLGNEAPRVTGIRTFRSGKDSLTIEAEVEWVTGKTQRVVVNAATTLVASVQIKVTDLRFRGVFTIVLEPLLNQLPGFGAVLVSFREQPRIDMDIGLLGGDITKLPGVLPMIENIIRTSLEDSLVWPSRVVVPIVPGDYKHLEFRPVGYLEVALVGGHDIPKADYLSKTDPFVLMYVHQRKEKMRKSSVKMNNQEPLWNELFFLEVEDPGHQDLIIRLMDYEYVQSAEFLGSCKIRLRSLKPKENKHFKVTLYVDPDKPGVGPPRGILHLHLTFVPYLTEEDERTSPAKAANEFALKHSLTSKSGNGLRMEAMDGKKKNAKEVGSMLGDVVKRGMGDGEEDEEEWGDSASHPFGGAISNALAQCFGCKGGPTTHDADDSEVVGSAADENLGSGKDGMIEDEVEKTEA